MTKEHAKPFNLKRGVQKALAANNIVCPIETPDTARRVVRALSLLHREQGFTYGMIAQACCVHPSNFNEWLNHGRRPTIGPKVVAFVNACASPTTCDTNTQFKLPTATTITAATTTTTPSFAAVAHARRAHKARALRMASQRVYYSASSSEDDDTQDHDHDHEVPSTPHQGSAALLEFLGKVRSPGAVSCGGSEESGVCRSPSEQQELDSCWEAAAALLMLTH